MGKHDKLGAGKPRQGKGKHALDYTASGFPVAKPHQRSVTEILLRLMRERKDKSKS